ncbi:MAG: 1,4-alpha-glucan branching protein GlgB [Clostridia bacterium]|nr:1,4-alpha-glucan branching protein GlgB [Clostridia bacterium]
MNGTAAEEQLKSFHAGTNSKAYELYGCNCTEDSLIFRVWAPHALSVWLHIEGLSAVSMNLMEDGESYEYEIPGGISLSGCEYCYEIHTKDGRTLRKADPYGSLLDCKSGMSVIYRRPEPDGFRPKNPGYREPVNIFEVNLFSWARRKDKSCLSGTELEKRLVPYVSGMGYTHVEFMPVNEFPYDGSWGYQVTGYFAGTQRLGKPEEIARLADSFREKGIGVIIDWVPAHFPKDEWGLYEFDGQPLYESSLWDRMEQPGWGTRRFAYERPEVVSFLLSSARYLVECFHADGLRIDAVASMLYLDYARKPGDFTPNKYGDNRNLEGIAFLQSLNEMLHNEFPGIMVIAEDSSVYRGVTGPVPEGGLGFDYKWDLGWMNDTLFYMKQDPYFRRWHHDKLTFSMMYAFNEKFILPLSHDEVVHVKGSILNKMPGQYEDKFAGERLLLGYMYSHPGKKLNFMGYDIAQFDEWDYNGHIQYELKKFPMHRKMQAFVKAVNGIYKDHPALYEEDSWDGYRWLVVDDRDSNVIVYERTAPAAGEKIIAVLSFCGADHNGYRFGCEEGRWQVILNSDAKKWGGRGVTSRKRIYKTEKLEGEGQASLCMDIPKLSCIYLKKIQ